MQWQYIINCHIF